MKKILIIMILATLMLCGCSNEFVQRKVKETYAASDSLLALGNGAPLNTDDVLYRLDRIETKLDSLINRNGGTIGTVKFIEINGQEYTKENIEADSSLYPPNIKIIIGEDTLNDDCDYIIKYSGLW